MGRRTAFWLIIRGFAGQHQRWLRTAASCSRGDQVLSVSFVVSFAAAGKMAAAPSRPFDYLEGLPGTVFFKLYQQPSTALAIFRRMLPDLGMLVVDLGWEGKDSVLIDYI